MPAGLFCAAILPAVSPGLTATFWPFDAGERASGLALGVAGWGRALVTGAGLTDAWAGGGDEGLLDGLAAPAACRPGQSRPPDRR